MCLGAFHPLIICTNCPRAPQGNVVRPGWNGFNVIHDSASRVAALDIGFAPSAAVRQTPNPNPKLVYLLGADDWEESAVPKGAFVVYQGHHGDKGAARADVVLPGAPPGGVRALLHHAVWDKWGGCLGCDRLLCP